MSFLDRINPFKTETRAASNDGSWAHMQRDHTTPVDARSVENLATALASVQAIASGVSSLPAYTYRRAGNGRVFEPDHPLQLLINRGPHRYQSWPDFIEWLIASALLRGNALVEIVRDDAGRLEALKPIPWEWVSVQLLPSGRMVFDVTEQLGKTGAQGRLRRLLDDEVIHLKDRSDDGYVGRSRLSRAGTSMSAAIAVQNHANATFKQGGKPGGILTFPDALSAEKAKLAAEKWQKAFNTPDGPFKTAILDMGAKFQPMTVTPEDAELLASRRFSGEEIARIFGVPPAIVGDLQFGTFTNAETAGRWFAQHTLTPWIRKIEAEFGRAVFNEAQRSTHYLDLDLSGLLRGDPETRWQSHKIAVDAGILDADEVRTVEGWNPRGQANG